MVFQFGVPPNRIDLINDIERVVFEEAWDNKEIVKMRNLTVNIIGLDDLINNKKTMKRPKDFDDLKYLEKAKQKRK